MGEILKFKKPKASEKHQGNLLCKRNFHKWEIDQKKQFDVKQGRLVTVYKCKRCGKFKTETK